MTDLGQSRIKKALPEAEDRRGVARLTKVVSAALGANFFRLLTEHLCEAFGADCVYIAEVVGGPVSRLKVVSAHWASGQPQDFPPDLSGTASQQVLRDGVVAWRANARRIFPLDPLLKEMEAESYVGVRLCDSAGQVLGLMAVVSNVPPRNIALVKSGLEAFAPRVSAELERKKADDALRESEERHVAFISFNPDAMWRIEFEKSIPLNLPEEEQLENIYQHGYVAECNQAMARIAGAPNAEDLIGARFAALFSPSDERIRDELRSAIRAGFSATTFATTVVGNDGKKQYRLRTQFGIVENNQLQRIWGTTRDVTELKRAELAIQVSEQRFREVFEGIELPAIMLDTGGVITFCNDSFAGLAHSSAKDLARTNWLGFIDLPAEREIWTTLLSGGADAQTSHCHFESSMHPPGVHPRRIAWNAILLRDVDGEPDGVAAIGRDVTDERALEARLLQAQKLESVGRLAGGVAHDFNNLLTVIMGYVTVALKQLDPESATYKGLLEAELAAEQCAALTQQLLAIGRRQQLRPEHISLNGVIASDEGILRAMIAQNVELVMDLEPSLGFVFADPVQIRRILANLAKNASDAMPNGGTLTIATSNADADLVRSEAQTSISPGPYVRLTVADTGIGITEEVKEHMFDPFFTTKSAGKGTGLGLSTVYGIIAQSGGYVSVRSEPGLGTTFEILLPRSQTAADTGTPGTDTHKP